MGTLENCKPNKEKGEQWVGIRAYLSMNSKFKINLSFLFHIHEDQ
jgi:hypothetical protein